MVKAFCNRSSLRMKRGSIYLNHRWKDCHWNGIIQLLLGKCSLKLPFSSESWPQLWYADGVILVGSVPHGQTINSDVYIQALKTLQRSFRELTSQNVDEILLPHDNACPHQCENTVSSHKTEMDCSFLPTIQPRSCCLRFPLLLSPQRCHMWGKGLGVMTRLLKNGCEYKIHTHTRRW